MDIYDIYTEMGLRKKNDYCFEGVFATGEFDELGDYGAGLLNVSISLCAKKSGYYVHFSIGTIDDGGWTAWLDFEQKEAAKAKLEEIARVFEEKMNRSLVLPTAKVLNEWLRLLGMYGTYQG